MEFVRAARLPGPPIEVGLVVVERPPELPKTPAASPLMRLLPIAMVVATAGMMALYFTSGAGIARNPMYLLFPVMMLVSALGSLAYGARGTGRELDQGRRDYVRYLDDLHDAAARTADAQHRSACRSHPEPATLWTLAGRARMWERGPGDPDFGHVRVGLGEQPLSTPLVAPELRSSEAFDPVTSDALDRLLRERSNVPHMPMTVELLAQAVVVVAGDVDRARRVVRAMLCQLAVFHGPEHVAIAAVVGRPACAAWDWLKWLPHHGLSSCSDDAGPARMTHRNLHDVPNGTASHTVVVIDGGSVSLPYVPVDGMTVVTVGEPPAGLVPFASLRIAHGEGAFGDQLDTMTMTQATVCAKRLARFAEPASAEGRWAAGGWSALTGIGDPDRLTPERLWRPRADRERLRVPIGVDERGEPVELDLKEAAYGGMGPHGLCVGATGSGKSEFLRTLTLGLVATHPPESLNFVLVDFKGGATFLGFERLNHVAAVITNLADDAHLVARMRDALSGELNRRQELLRAAGNVANMADYESARRRGAALAPLPTLFIVVDEFSELLSQHPDFVDLFVAIGRVGRSLGVHLLLASQRLDEGRLRGLETHLSYRICLKTFSASESRAVLGTVDAFDLPNTPGVAYLKTASGDLVRFRAAYVSAPVAIGGPPVTGRPVTVVAPFTATPVGGANVADPLAAAKPHSVLNAVLDGLTGRGEPAHRVWLPPIVAPPTLGAVLAHVTSGPALSVPIGLVDNAFEQRRAPFVAELRGAGGNVAVVGGPRSGKSTTLQTLVLALAATHDPAAVQLYGLDFGGGALSAVRSLPHVGAVAGRADGELIERVLARMEAIVRRRESVLRSGADEADRYGEVFLVIDGWAAARQECAGLEEAVTAIAAQGLSVGVHVVIAAARWGELRPALKDQLGTRIELRLGDAAESEFDRKRARLLAGRPAGHGITCDGLDLVIATPRLDVRVQPDHDLWASTGAAIRTRHPGLAAPAVTALPTKVGYDTVVARSPTDVVLGVGGDEVEPITVDFTATPHVLIIGEGRCGKTAALRTVCREVVRTNDAGSAQLVVVDVRRTLLGVVETEHLRAYAMSTVDAEARLSTLAAELRTRLPHGAVTQRQLRERSWWSGPDVYVVVDDYDLVAGAPVNPLSGLLELLPYDRDVGLHLVVARTSAGAARAMFDPVLAALRDLGCLGLMMSASPDDGALLGSVRPVPLPSGRATVIRRGQPDGQVQVAWADSP
ncbi:MULTISPECIES: type VII secretion protein EccCa [unclassified Mycobacterium]|uniref:type VII secretion protein EccCa n=1 Tax=unclassified Mycobacterium TaxID=2642494 RepID=UPI0029C98315|nr:MULTISPECIES: type VII secretion protein EccCa [unclassified Mycobacterium]